MPYSKNLNSITRVKKILDQMVEAKTNLSWPNHNPHMLAYRIREAMTLAEKVHYAPYHILKAKYIIRNKGSRVLAELREIDSVLETLQAAHTRVTLEQLSSLIEIIGGVIHAKAEEMFFPDADLSAEETNRLYLWCKEKDYFLIVAERGITITKTDPGEAKWEPT